MTQVFSCQCGKLLHGRDDNELVTAVARHLATGHRMTMSRDQILALAQRVDAGGAGYPAPDERQTSGSLPPTPPSYRRADSRATGSRHPTDARSDHHEHGDD